MSRRTTKAESLFQPQVIRASAGTGKTYQLAVRFIGLLASGARPEEILATTFTRKAAGEILDRVLFWLAEAAGDDEKRAGLAREIGRPALSREECRDLLVKTVRRLHCLKVGTLDSYFIQVAGTFGQELGLPPGWSICDEQADAQLREEAVERVLSHGRVQDLLTLVHALTKGDAARSVGRLVQDTVGSLWELYREATPAAWEQLPLVPGLPDAERERAIDALASYGLDDNRLRKARDQDLERFRAGDWDAFVSTGLANKVLCGDCQYYKKPLPPELVALYRLLLKHAESILVGQVARQTKATYELLTRFLEHYRALQLDERVLRFSDVTCYLADAAAAVGPERVAFRLDGGTRHLLLDEFQDTAPPQWRVLRPVARGAVERPGGSFFCVGDTKQAIYGWRGGVAEIFDALPGEIPGLEQSGLATSYRSAPPVIAAVNAVFQNLARHPNLDKLAEPVAQWQSAFPEHATKREHYAGHVTLTVAPQANEGEEQADVLFAHVAERVAAATQQAPGASVGVLVRTNAAVGRLIYLLRERDIPASEEGGNPLIDSPAVELVLSLFKLADHPGDRVARFHLATSPLAAADAELAAVWGRTAEGEVTPESDASAARFSGRLRRQLLGAGYGPTVFAWAQRLAEHCDARDLSRLQQLVELAYEYQPQSTLRTADFLRLVESKRIADPTSSDVRVMTIHQAKGLQFDIVFLPELNANLAGQRESFVAGRPGPTERVQLVCRLANEAVRQFFPAPIQRLFEEDTRREVSEALCVLYVAMTRAVHALHMIVPPARANEKSVPKTFAGLLRATLAGGHPATGGALLYETGDAAWFRSLPPARGEKSVSQPVARPAPQIQLQPPAVRGRGLERASPSGLEGGVRVCAAHVLAPRAEAALGVGTLYHAWLEQIAWLDDGSPSDDALRQIAERLRSETGDLKDELATLLARFRKQLRSTTVAAVFQRDYYRDPAPLGLNHLAGEWPAGDVQLHVERERPFAIRRGETLLSGSIDRLVTVRSRGRAIAADIVDFKTDDLAAGDQQKLTERIAFYRPQIEAYRVAAAALLHLDLRRIAARLVFLSPGVVHSCLGSASPGIAAE